MAKVEGLEYKLQKFNLGYEAVDLFILPGKVQPVEDQMERGLSSPQTTDQDQGIGTIAIAY
jgi:hypothetical protein